MRSQSVLCGLRGAGATVTGCAGRRTQYDFRLARHRKHCRTASAGNFDYGDLGFEAPTCPCSGFTVQIGDDQAMTGRPRTRLLCVTRT